jgi:hypothetical protein
MRLKWLLVMPLVVLSLSVSAGPLDEAKGKAHLDAVAAGDIETLMRDYAEDAYMDWIGGPLDGRYRGKAAIRAVWEKFIAANNGQPRPVKRSEIEPYTSPKGVSLEASAEYGGKTPVKVWHVLVYRDGEMTTEIWQVAPSIKVSP